MPQFHGRWRMAVLMLVAAALTSCSPSEAETVASGQPLEVEVTMAEDEPLEVEVTMAEDHPLKGEATVSGGGSDPVRIEISGEDGSGFGVTPAEAGSGLVTIPILGVRPESTYTVTARAGERTTIETFDTGSLPDDLPPLDVAVASDTGGGGLTLYDAAPVGPSEAPDHGFLIAVDSSGEIVWYYRQTHSMQDARRTDSGDLLFIHHETGVRLLDPATEEMVEFSGVTGLDVATADERGLAYAGADAIRVETDQMHHEVIELPNGNLMTLSRELRTIDGFPEPICEEDDEFAGSYEVGTDTIVEFDPENGDVVSEWSLFDYVDPLDELDVIVAPEFCGPYLDPVYPDMAARDWTHANAVVLDKARNVLWISVRHLDQLLAVRYEDDEGGPAGELVWRLGEGGDFTLEEGEWFLHQHAPQVLDDGSLMIYDNGNHRAGTSLDDPENQPYSRAVQYQLDTESMTARQVWEHRLDEPGTTVYAPFVGDADMLEGGTVLITHGGQLDPPAESPAAEGVTVWAQIIEVDYETGEVLADMRVKDPQGEDSWRVYRAERIETLYPAEFEVEKISP